ncbi:MAG: sigma-54-dependent transcriptional regulator [Gemmatimonadales bacterium]
MSNEGAQILIIDDESAILETLSILFKNSGFSVVTAQGGRAGMEALTSMAPDVVLTDIKMAKISGMDILKRARELDPEMPVVVMTAHADLQSAIQSVNDGAFAFIQKPFENDELVNQCRRAAQTRALKAENKSLKREIRRRDESAIAKPIGKSKAFLEVMKLADQVAPTDSTVLILGESGTGKEVLSRYLHRLSDRADGPFFSINCGALPEGLLESELFGHVKGSFTGAVRDKEGMFIAARGGTFFLDEIGETKPSTQVKLLRVLQEREALPVGGTEPVPVDVRVIAATNKDPEEEIRRGTFRADLYYRLNVITLHIPPLRERGEDIVLLAEAFLKKIAESRSERVKHLTRDALDAMSIYEWPGNVRELENALEHAAVMSTTDEIGLDMLPARIRDPKPQPFVADRPPGNPTLETMERAYINWVLQAEGGNKTRAAEVLGIDPSTLYRKLARYDDEDQAR